MTNTHDKPLAAPGLISYRYRNGAYGWIMIGAKNHSDAMREAGRSITFTDENRPQLANLQMWDGTKYADIE